MAARLPKTLGGIPAVTARDILARGMLALDEVAYTIAGTKKRKRFSRPDEASIERARQFVDAMRAEGFIEEDASHPDRPYRVTEAARPILQAKGYKPIASDRAHAIVTKFLDICAEIRQDSAWPVELRDVYLFGSHLRGEAEVGDVDIALDGIRLKSGKPGAELKSFVQARYRNWNPDDIMGPTDLWLARRATVSRLRRAGRSLSMVDSHTLEGLQCPCRLIWDQDCGAVNGPLLDTLPARNPFGAKRAGER